MVNETSQSLRGDKSMSRVPDSGRDNTVRGNGHEDETPSEASASAIPRGDSGGENQKVMAGPEAVP